MGKDKKKKSLEEKLSEELDTMHIETIHGHNILILPHESHIFLFGVEGMTTLEPLPVGEEPGVEYVMSNIFIRNANIARKANPGKPLLIHLKTCGGLWEEGMAIYDTIKSYPAPVTALNYTHARSMSSLVFLAADKRVMMPNSYFMFHEGSLSFNGTSKQVHSFINHMDMVDNMIDIYAKILMEQGEFKKNNKSEEWIKKWLRNEMNAKEDVYLPAQVALEWGFPDEIFDNNWDNLLKFTDKQLMRRGFAPYEENHGEYGKMTKYKLEPKVEN